MGGKNSPEMESNTPPLLLLLGRGEYVELKIELNGVKSQTGTKR